ncbi:MAG: hypothetical protein M0Z40_13620 [Actinomycetota bacterium]|nr:hypothetical protein [Actinomycetota bacterium]
MTASCPSHDGVHALAGLATTSVRYAASFWIFAVVVFVAVAALLAYVSVRCLLASSRSAGASAAPPSSSPVSAPCAERDGGATPQGARPPRTG